MKRLGRVLAASLFLISITSISYGIISIVSGFLKPSIAYPVLVTETKTTTIANQLAPYVRELGLPTNQVNFLLAENPTCLAVACYSADTIYITPDFYQVSNTNKNLLKVTIAHEYLHFVWDNLSIVKRQELTRELENIQIDNPYLKVKLSYYKRLNNSPDYLLNELHSITGTELKDNHLTPKLLEHYNQYVPNRTVLERSY